MEIQPWPNIKSNPTSCSTSYARSAALLMVDGSDPRSLAGNGFDLRRRCDIVRMQGERCFDQQTYMCSIEKLLIAKRDERRAHYCRAGWFKEHIWDSPGTFRIFQFDPAEKKERW